MDFENERYIRVYTRDTLTWKLWSWEARAVWLFLLRKCDRAGVIDIGRIEPAKAIHALTDVPLEVVERVLPEIIDGGAIDVGKDALVARRYIEANEAKQSDSHRQRESRARRRDRALADTRVTNRDEPPGGMSHGVTPSLAEPSLASRAEPTQRRPVTIDDARVAELTNPEAQRRARVSQAWTALTSGHVAHLTPRKKRIKWGTKPPEGFDDVLDDFDLKELTAYATEFAALVESGAQDLRWWRKGMFKPKGWEIVVNVVDQKRAEEGGGGKPAKHRDAFDRYQDGEITKEEFEEIRDELQRKYEERLRNGG